MNPFKRLYPDLKKIRDFLSIAIRARLMAEYDFTSARVNDISVTLSPLEPDGAELKLTARVILMEKAPEKTEGSA